MQRTENDVDFSNIERYDNLIEVHNIDALKQEEKSHEIW